MKKGEKCILQCSPDYAYGKSGIGPIPGNSTLFFEVELLDWTKPGESFVERLPFGYFILIVGVLIFIFYNLFNVIYPQITNTIKQ